MLKLASVSIMNAAPKNAAETQNSRREPFFQFKRSPNQKTTAKYISVIVKAAISAPLSVTLNQPGIIYDQPAADIEARVPEELRPVIANRLPQLGIFIIDRICKAKDIGRILLPAAVL